MRCAVKVNSPCPVADESLESEKTRYQVTVITGDRKYAGTDANVFLEMIGKDGRSGEVELDDEKNNFERAMTDVFKVRRESVSRNQTDVWRLYLGQSDDT